MGPVVIAALLLLGFLFLLRTLVQLFTEGGTRKPVTAGDLSRQELIEQRNKYLDALRELDEDLEMNKISAEDKKKLEGVYSQKALEIIEQLEASAGSSAKSTPKQDKQPEKA